MTILFRFFLADPGGDIELLPQDLEQPFRISPAEVHPFLTLQGYFGALQKFIARDNNALLRAVQGKLHPPQEGDNAQEFAEVHLRSEKHGAFYHIASATFLGPGKNVKFALTTALSEPARNSLQEEYTILQRLGDIMPGYLPELFDMDGVTWQTDAGTAEFIMVLAEWLNGYHEWHLSDVPGSPKQQIQLWDYEKGFRFLTDAEGHALLRQVAYILTCCYDQASFCQIYPWHHGAGDFVVKVEPGSLSVKLITARQYEPLVDFAGKEEAERIVAAIHFLLNLVLRIRLDRLDGVGAAAWLDDFALPAALEGFFAGLAATGDANRLKIGPVADFLEIMQSFSVEEIYSMYESLLELYGDEDPDDLALIKDRLPGHAVQMHETLRDFTLD
jgi:hypothetical protein